MTANTGSDRPERPPKEHQRYERILIWDCGHQVDDPDDPHCLQCGYPKCDNWGES